VRRTCGRGGCRPNRGADAADRASTVRGRNHYLRGAAYFDGVGRKKDGVIVTRGIPLELLARLGVCKVSDKTIHQHNIPSTASSGLKILADELLQAEPNLRFLYYTLVVDAVMDGDRIREVVLANKGGLLRVEPGIVIDTTGDADVAARAGAPLDESQELMPLTLHFRIATSR